jgi:hypothetical protein
MFGSRKSYEQMIILNTKGYDSAAQVMNTQIYWWMTLPEPEMSVDTTGLPQ